MSTEEQKEHDEDTMEYSGIEAQDVDDDEDESSDDDSVLLADIEALK